MASYLPLSLLILIQAYLAASQNTPTACVSNYEWLEDACSAMADLDAPCQSQQRLPLPLIGGQTSYEAANTTCQCTRVYFNLYVGCKLCQSNQDSSLQWSQWTKPCYLNSTIYYNQTTIDTIPNWAKVNTNPDDLFDMHQAKAVFQQNNQPSTRWPSLAIILASIGAGLALLFFILAGILFCRRKSRPFRVSSSLGSSSSSTIGSWRTLKFPSWFKFGLRPYKAARASSSRFDLADGDTMEDERALLSRNAQPVGQGGRGQARSQGHVRGGSEPMFNFYVPPPTTVSASVRHGDRPIPIHSPDPVAREQLRIATIPTPTSPPPPPPSQQQPRVPRPRGARQPSISGGGIDTSRQQQLQQIYTHEHMRNSAVDLPPPTPLPTTPPGFRD